MPDIAVYMGPEHLTATEFVEAVTGQPDADQPFLQTPHLTWSRRNLKKMMARLHNRIHSRGGAMRQSPTLA